MATDRYALPNELKRALGYRQSGLTSGRAVHYVHPTYGATPRYHERNYSTGTPAPRNPNLEPAIRDGRTHGNTTHGRRRTTVKTASGPRTVEVWTPDAWKNRVASSSY